MASSSQTLAPSGGKAYEKMTYDIRVKEEFCKPGTKPRNTEAKLVKKSDPTDLDSVIFRTPTGDYTKLTDYLENYAVSPFNDWWDPWMFIEVLVRTVALHNSGWIDGMFFKDGTAPSDPPTYIPTPPPAPSYANVASNLATFTIRHTTRKVAMYDDLRTATLTFSALDDYFITEGPTEQYISSLTEWHLGGHATKDNIAKHLATNGEPWAHIHVLVGGEWIIGNDFLAMRE